MNKVVSVVLSVIVLIAAANLCSAAKQQDLKDRLFEKANELFAKAKSEQSDLLSPTIYGKAVEINEEAVKDFEKGKSIEKKLVEIENLLQQALENTKLAKVTFPHLLVAREDALKANAPQFAFEFYEKAEKDFLEAAKSIEKGDLNKAKEKAITAEKSFRESELFAIKSSIVGSVKNLIEKSKQEDAEKYSPQTLKKAEQLLSEAENILNSDRGAKSLAREKAEQAEYETNHAIYLANKIKKLKEDEKNWEKLILEHEKHFSLVIEELNFTPKFDTGFEHPASSAVVAIKNLKEENKNLKQEVSAQSDEVDKLTAELNTLKQKYEGVQAKLDIEKKREEKFKKIEQVFSPNEAVVFREGEKVTMRLVSLNFASGKAVITPEYFSRLSKVQRAIRTFPDYLITVEGHTDSRGDDRYNKNLSMDRANAVKEYLIANMGLNKSQITAIGYGESKPIASNETDEGRTKNRRIDIVLEP